MKTDSQLKKLETGNSRMESTVQTGRAKCEKRAVTFLARSTCLVLLGAGAACITLALGKEAYNPKIDPANFKSTVDNPYFPLVPGTVFTYVEKVGGETSENEVTVTHETKTLLGVKCVVVHDTVKTNGQLKEDTYDWYAQDKQGTVWYFGEDTKEFKAGGAVDTKGSWQGGVNGVPGIMMPANPKPGKPYRQEYSPNNAEDMGQIVAVDEKVTVPAGTYSQCVKTLDWSLLEAGHENKWYAKGVGVVKATATGGEVETLISIKKP